MTEKKGENQVAHILGSVSELLVEGIFGSIRNVISGAVESAEKFVDNVTKKVAQGIFFTFCALVGLVYIFSGAEDWLNANYSFPGIGGLAVGGVLVFVALVSYLFSRK